MALRSANIYEIYLAYLGRPPDAYALLYEPFKSSTQLPPEVFATFANSAEYAALAGADLHYTAGLVNDTYYRLFDRAADLAGLNYWAGLVDSGALPIELMPMAILQGAAGADANTAANKLLYSQLALTWFSPKQRTDYAGMEAAFAGRAYLVSIDTGIVGTPERIHELLLEKIAAMFSGIVPHPPGAAFTLTSQADQVDTITPTTLQNTAFGLTSSGPDVFQDASGDIAGLPPHRFDGDRLDGGAGIDTLKLLNADADTSAAQITSVERVEASFQLAGSVLDLSGVPDLQTLVLRSTDTVIRSADPDFVTVRGISSGVTVEANLVVGGTGLLLEYADRALPDQSATIDLTGSHAILGDRTTILSVPDIEHLTIEVGPHQSGPAGTVLPLIDAAQATTLQIEATDAVRLGSLQLASGAQVTICSDSAVSTGNSAAAMPECNVVLEGAAAMDARLSGLASFTTASSGTITLALSATEQVHVAETGTGAIHVVFHDVGHAWATGGAQPDSFVLTDPRTIAVLTGGDGSDDFTFTNVVAGADLDALIAGAPTVTDFGTTPGYAGDRLHFTDPLHVSQCAAGGPGVAIIDAAGHATFDPSDVTLRQKIVAVAAGIQAGTRPGEGSFAEFVQDGDTYLFKSAEAAPLVDWSGTELVRLAGTVLDPSHFGIVAGALVAW